MFSSVIQRLNDRRSAAGETGEDAGFTLIELMVVLLILAILLAIAIPTFLGVTKSANDRAAQSNLNTALVNAKAQFQQNGQSYTGGTAPLTPATLATAEPSLSFQAGVSTGQGNISVYVSSDGNGIVLTSFSKSGNCWILADNTQTITNAPTINPTTYVGATAPGLVPLAAGTQYGKVTGTTSAACGSGLALTGATFSTTGFPS